MLFYMTGVDMAYSVTGCTTAWWAHTEFEGGECGTGAELADILVDAGVAHVYVGGFRGFYRATACQETARSHVMSTRSIVHAIEDVDVFLDVFKGSESPGKGIKVIAPDVPVAMVDSVGHEERCEPHRLAFVTGSASGERATGGQHCFQEG